MTGRGEGKLFPKDDPSETDKDCAQDQSVCEVDCAVRGHDATAVFCASMARALGVAVT